MTIAEWYLANSNGDLVRYHQDLRKGYRLGQAFFNALSTEDQAYIRGSLFDPFYRTKTVDIERALDYLTTK